MAVSMRWLYNVFISASVQDSVSGFPDLPTSYRLEPSSWTVWNWTLQSLIVGISVTPDSRVETSADGLLGHNVHHGPMCPRRGHRECINV